MNDRGARQNKKREMERGVHAFPRGEDCAKAVFPVDGIEGHGQEDSPNG